jgi:serine phosphatase RsbU (regulator of sigma subunit)
MLVLYTDGLVETRQREYDTGIDMLCSALSALDPHTGPDDACDALLHALIDNRQEDDVALLAVCIGASPNSRTSWSSRT